MSYDGFGPNQGIHVEKGRRFKLRDGRLRN